MAEQALLSKEFKNYYFKRQVIMQCPSCGSDRYYLHPHCDGVVLDSTYICSRCGHQWCNVGQAAVGAVTGWVPAMLIPVLLLLLVL